MMAEKDKIEKRADKNSKANVLQKIGAAFIKIGKRLKGFFINLKAELKRVIWPDRKRPDSEYRDCSGDLHNCRFDSVYR